MEIPKRHWQGRDGSYKSMREDCHTCRWYREILGNSICGWGAAFKYLIEIQDPKKCEVMKRAQGQDASVIYLDSLIKQIDKV